MGNLPKWCRHPDKQPQAMYLQPEDFMGSRKRSNPSNFTIAHIGAQCSMFEGQGFKMLEKATAEELDMPDNEGFTPLHWAVLSDNPKAVIWLLKHGADRDTQDARGNKAEDLIDDFWGDFYQRHYEHGPKNNGQPTPEKCMTKRVKQMKEAFKQASQENEYDLIGYKAIQV